MNTLIQKPSHEEWLYWSDVVIDRLSTCVKTYAKPPFDVFMSEKEREARKAATLDLLRRVYALIDSADTPTDSLADVAHHDEQVMGGLSVLLKETLERLPELSLDMQKLLKSPWKEGCNGKIASELFCGPNHKESEGIGSGHPEHGRLPEVLQNLLEREQLGDGRQPREALHRSPSTTAHPAEHPHREAPRRWADKKAGGHLRTAGRMD